MDITGQIHSVESCGTVDGPGIRFVIFTQGCPLHCLYCHNPDSRTTHGGRTVTVDAMVKEVQKYRSYMRYSGGGLTISGGEPLMQPEFVAAVFKNCQELGIHTALDTSGHAHLEIAKNVIEYTDLVLLDIKSYNPSTYQKVTHVDLKPTLDMAEYLNVIHKPTWIRFVLVPGLTDDAENIEGLAKFIATLDNVEKLEILPFHQMGAYKWEELGYDYQLKTTPAATKDDVERAMSLFSQYVPSLVAVTQK